MLVKEIVNRFKEKRPVALMARMALARLLAPQAIDQVFHSDSRTECAVSTLERCLRTSSIFCRAPGRIGRLRGISL
jgi:hypothetical protein